MSERAKNASMSTLMVMSIKVLRNEHGVHQGHMAKMIGKSPSAWSKIENGQSPMTVDAMIGACWALQLSASYVMALVERMVLIFNAQGYYFQTTPLEDGEDELLPLVLEYFASPGYEVMKNNISASISLKNVCLDPKTEITSDTPTIIRYCCDPEFKKWVDEGAVGWSPAPAQVGLGLPGLVSMVPNGLGIAGSWLDIPSGK